MIPNLTQEQQQALDEHDGFVQDPAYVLMSMDVFRNTMGVASDDELQASLRAIHEAVADLAAGRTIPLAEARRSAATTRKSYFFLSTSASTRGGDMGRCRIRTPTAR
jgi:hypothetical protein